jgi:hypothetical protein
MAQICANSIHPHLLIQPRCYQQRSALVPLAGSSCCPAAGRDFLSFINFFEKEVDLKAHFRWLTAL